MTLALKLLREVITRKVIILIPDISLNLNHYIYITVQREIINVVGDINNCLLDTMRGYDTISIHTINQHPNFKI